MIKGSTTWYNALTNRLGGNFGLAAVATAVLAYRLVSFWAVVAGGWVVFFFLRRRDRLSRQAQDGLPSAGPEPESGPAPEQGGDRP